MSNLLPKILLIHSKNLNFKSFKFFEYEEDKFEIITILDDTNLNAILAKIDPDCIISIGPIEKHLELKELYKSSFNIRKRWIHLEETDPYIGQKVCNAAFYVILNSINKQDIPLVSICTPTYNIGEKIYRTYESLKNQTYIDWEWVIVDDSSKPETYELLKKLSLNDYRIKLYNIENKSNGNIGEVKYRTNMLASGEYLIELDHDDILLPNAIEEVVKAFQTYPDAEFVFSNCSEIDEYHNSFMYPEGWAFGYGSYRQEEYNGIVYNVAITANINPKTIRHIVSAPNHLRAWTKNIYHKIGGHNRRLTIADDYELMVRLFLNTKCTKIDKMLYFQFYHDSNSQNQNRSEIQRKVRAIYEHYNDAIKNRFIELGINDWAYEENPQFPLNTPSKFGESEQFVNYII